MLYQKSVSLKHFHVYIYIYIYEGHSINSVNFANKNHCLELQIVFKENSLLSVFSCHRGLSERSSLLSTVPGSFSLPESPCASIPCLSQSGKPMFSLFVNISGFSVHITNPSVNCTWPQSTKIDVELCSNTDILFELLAF